MTTKIFKNILLIALPASGKSEVRRYLELLPIEKSIEEFHIGLNVQLDDFPYVHMMRRIDQELIVLQLEPIFYHGGDGLFVTSKEWGTLIHLVNEDYDDMKKQNELKPESAALDLFDRIDRAGKKCGIPERLSLLGQTTLHSLAHKLDAECQEMLDNKNKLIEQSKETKTTVIEFARGGMESAEMPLKNGQGYQYSLSHLSDDILKDSVVLYIWVTPQESRRKNFKRANPDDPGSILNHGVPLEVMFFDYGCDDIEYLEGIAEKPGTITIEANGKKYNLPFAKFDNRKDKTSFLRDDQSKWKEEDVKAVHDGLKQALDQLAESIE